MTASSRAMNRDGARGCGRWPPSLIDRARDEAEACGAPLGWRFGADHIRERSLARARGIGQCRRHRLEPETRDV